MAMAGQHRAGVLVEHAAAVAAVSHQVLPLVKRTRVLVELVMQVCRIIFAYHSQQNKG